ncbi:MAG: DUF3179 domain-containing protein, partial [Chloroflexi bacterium]|nr:DUF3179 domain-containing protein [Chloroflexota bacterium]
PRAQVAAATPTPTPPRDLPDADVEQTLRAAVCWYERPAAAAACTPPGPEVVAAIERMALSRDRRFVAPLVDMLALDVGWERFVREALARITGLELAGAHAWYAWLAEQRPPLPPGYATWKGRLLSLVDARFPSLVNEALGERVRPHELLWGQVAPDELPPLVGPRTAHRVEERFLGAGDVVFGLVVDDEARAYPERILGWHPLVRDRVGGTNVIVSLCVPCGSAAAYRATSSSGTAYTIGTAGLVYRSRRLLYDDLTKSLWDPVAGAAIAGPLAASGVRLEPLPLLRTTWREWAERHPGTRVVSLDTGHVRDYAEGAATRLDRESAAPLFPAGAVDGRMPAKERVLGLELGGEAKAYPLAALEAARVVHDRVGGRDVVLVSLGPGTGVSVYDASGVRFSRVEGPRDALEIVDGDGVRWFMDQRRLVNSRNSRVREALPSRTAYWFAWAGAFPGTGLWRR